MHVRTPVQALFGLLTALALLVSVSPVGAQNETEGGAPPRPQNLFGVNLFLHKEVEPWKIEKTLRMVAEANIPWIKQEFPWQEIEFKKGYFYDDKWQKSSWEKFDQIVDLASRYNLTVIARIDHPPAWAQGSEGSNAPLKDNKDLADFTNALLDHYAGKINHVQLWNEPNLADEWVPGRPVDPEGYVEMLREVYPAVKAAHPDSVILSAPLAMTLEGPELRGNMNELDYWQGMYNADAKGLFDIASANGYGLDLPPNAPPDRDVLNFRRVELIREIMERADDGDTPIWFNEFAWNASPESLAPEERDYWRNVTPEEQAEYTVQGIEYARENWSWAGVLSIWYFRQVGDIPPEKAEYYFGMVEPDFTTMPVYEAVKEAAAAYPGPAGSLPAEVQNPEPTATGEAAASPTLATPEEGPTATAAQPAVPTPTPTVAPSGSGGDSAVLLYVLGGALVVGGLAALAFYMMRRRPS